ncbi:hypothetical protein AYO38_05430 [bacterium SCGC AG-212-C10]|nr:hypothetical protein AYO38_05430 [bacterium SCGC AG-212-C10]
MSRKQAEPEAAENHERWIVSYADMVTLLWALFVVLYALSDSNPRKLLVVQQSIDRAFEVGVFSGSTGSSAVLSGGGGIAPNVAGLKASVLESLSKEIMEFTSQNNLGNRIQVRADATSITISVTDTDNLLFGSGSADLRPGSQVVLDEIASLLEGLPNQIRVEGHTDNVPVNSDQYDSNWELSAARSVRVLRYMTENAGLPADRFSQSGFGDTRPIAENTTPEGRALNRRADIVILYPTQQELDEALAGAGTTPKETTP